MYYHGSGVGGRGGDGECAWRQRQRVSSADCVSATEDDIERMWAADYDIERMHPP
jgi:hypothetical protein